MMAPVGPVYQAGTLSGNPVAVSAGLATLDEITHPEFYQHLEASTQYLAEGIKATAKENGIPVVVNHTCGLFGIFFTEQPCVTSFAEVKQCDTG